MLPTPVPDGSTDSPYGSEDAALEVNDVGRDANDVEASVPTASDALRRFPRAGSSSDDGATPRGGGVVLDGGYGGASVTRWIHHVTFGDEPARGDVVILTALDGDGSAGWPVAGTGTAEPTFHSAQTVSLAASATPDDFRIAAAIVSRAEVVWFTGGDQAAYVRWKGTPLLDAVDDVVRRGGVVGGASAGMIIMGEHVNDALVTLSENITTAVALANPYDTRLHFTQRVLHVDLLARVVTDPHFTARDRMGRLAAFMARQVIDGFASPDVLGVAVDDGAALAIAADGTAARLTDDDTSTAAVFIVRGGSPGVAEPNQPLVYPRLHVVKLARGAHSFDFKRRCGRGFIRDFDVNGTSSPPYPATAYTDGSFADECP